jgi:hypothetical protein
VPEGSSNSRNKTSPPSRCTVSLRLLECESDCDIRVFESDCNIDSQTETLGCASQTGLKSVVRKTTKSERASQTFILESVSCKS